MKNDALEEKKGKKARCGRLLFLLGAVLMALGAVALLSIGDGLQYILPAPAVTQEGGELEALYEEAMEQLAGMGDVLTTSAVGARLQTVGFSGGGQSLEATLYAIGAGYFDVKHERLLQGRLISETDVRRAERVAVLDERALLKLFPGEDSIGQKVTIFGEEYEVVGVVGGGRRLGEVDEYVMYIPITAASEQAIAMQTFEIRAKGTSAIGSAILMEDTLGAWESGGSFQNLNKLKLGAVMPLRWLLLFVGGSILLALLRRMNAWTWGRVCHFSDELRLKYAIHMLPQMVGSALVCIAGYAALAAVTYLLADFSIKPLLTFTEWVPEVVVELSSLADRFWSLNAVSAVAARYVSRETCVIELGRSLLRWGLLAALLGGVLHGVPWLNRDVPMPKRKTEWELDV